MLRFLLGCVLLWGCTETQGTEASSTSSAGGTSASSNTASTAASNASSTGSGGAGGGTSTTYGFPPEWPNGTRCGNRDDIFVWKYADDTYILRQSLCTSFEGPFLYLFFGADKALLEDTGDGGIPVQAVVQGIVDEWKAAHNDTSLELVVAHSHAHGDHVAGDAQFANQPSTTVVGTGVSAVQAHFGITSWPTQIVSYDLGSRIVDVIPIPGHQSAHIAIYDRRHELLLTGDTLYPGRLYISDFAAYQASTQRLVDFVAQNPVQWVLGTHIEMTTTPTQDFPFGASQHPNEHALELTPSHLTELNDAVQAMGNNPSYQEHPDFIIYPL